MEYHVMTNRNMTDKELSKIELLLIEAMAKSEAEEIVQALERTRRLIMLRKVAEQEAAKKGG